MGKLFDQHNQRQRKQGQIDHQKVANVFRYL